jgi:penicillin-binding protein 2
VRLLGFGRPRHTDSYRDRAPEGDDLRPVAGKIAFFQYLTLAVFLLLISQFWRLQIHETELYAERADRNRIKALPLLAPRGKVLDRDGRVIVDNHAAFSLILSRENLRPEHLLWIADGLNLSFDSLSARIKRFENNPSYEPVIVKEELSPGELAFVEAHRDASGYPGMELIHAQRRLYPRDGFAAHVVGYVGEVSETDLNQIEFANLNQGDVIGKAGIERKYNHVLMGLDGQRRVVVDSFGRERDVEDRKEAKPGRSLELTIDLDLQTVAELAMENRRGAVVALDPRNGEVLAMVSRPAYDPNKFAGRIRTSDWQEIVRHPENPLLNRVTQAQLAPGSTFKPIVALAGLATGAIDDDFRVYCRGGATFYNRFFKCHKRGGHGHVNLYRALADSCDVYFYTVGNKLGIDTIAHYSELAGLGQRTGIDLPHEESGLVPSTKWKLRATRQKWYAGETISVSIGQGALTVTPLQLAYAIGGLANHGVFHRPHLVAGANKEVKPHVIDVDRSIFDRINAGLWAVVNDGGTGVRARLPGLDVCGKTGTAQLASNAFIARTKAAEYSKDNAWFVGFAPRDNPELVVVALFEQGEHGNLAAPIVRDVLKAYFDKKARQRHKPLVASFRPSPVPSAVSGGAAP